MRGGGGALGRGRGGQRAFERGDEGQPAGEGDGVGAGGDEAAARTPRAQIELEDAVEGMQA